MQDRFQFLHRILRGATASNSAAENAQLEKPDPSSQTKQGVEVKPLVWPKEVENGTRGPKLGDIPLHNDL